jgi:hypothetical protein
MKKLFLAQVLSMCLVSQAMADNSSGLVPGSRVTLELHSKISYVVPGTNLGFINTTGKNSSSYVLVYLNSDGKARVVHRDASSGEYYIHVSGPDKRTKLNISKSVVKNVLSQGTSDAKIRHGCVYMQIKELELLTKKNLVEGISQNAS